MKKKLLFPLAVSSFALLVGLTACGGGHNEGGESKGSSEPGTVETARKILNASIKKPVLNSIKKLKFFVTLKVFHIAQAILILLLLMLKAISKALMVVWHVLLSVKKAILIKY